MIFEENKIQTNKEEKLLKPRFLELLSKATLTEEELMEVYILSAEHFNKYFSNNTFDTQVEFINDSSRPISQVGFSVNFDNNAEFHHVIFANEFFLKDYPVERIILIACHEAAHLEKNDVLAKKHDFSNLDEISIYEGEIKRKDSENWYLQEEETRADKKAFFVAKNVFQRAVHDTEDPDLKSAFWDSFGILYYNEQVEMAKHFQCAKKSDELYDMVNQPYNPTTSENKNTDSNIPQENAPKK